MNILFYRYGSICEPDILECFIESGHNIVEVKDEIENKNITYQDTLSIVERVLNDSSCDCIFSINYYPALSDICNVYHIRYICWTVDSPVLELFDKSITNPWNRVFIFDREQYNDIHHLNPNCIFHYPLAVNINTKQAVITKARTTGTASKYASDISFVGSMYSEKSPLSINPPTSEHLRGFIDGLAESQMKIYGYYFINSVLGEDAVNEFINGVPGYNQIPKMEYLSDKDLISQYYLGNYISVLERHALLKNLNKSFNISVYTASDLSSIPSLNSRGTCNSLTEMPIIFNNSKINLNPTARCIRSGIPLRALDIMACEGFMLSNYQPELCELFTPNEDFIFYDSIEAVPELINYYLEHNNERTEIAHNGFEKVKNSYNYLIRLNGLLLKAFEI